MGNVPKFLNSNPLSPAEVYLRPEEATLCAKAGAATLYVLVWVAAKELELPLWGSFITYGISVSQHLSFRSLAATQYSQWVSKHRNIGL